MKIIINEIFYVPFFALRLWIPVCILHWQQVSVQMSHISGARRPCVLASGHPAGLHNLGPGSLQFSPFFHPQLSCCHFCFSCITYKHLSIVLNFYRDIALIACVRKIGLLIPITTYKVCFQTCASFTFTRAPRAGRAGWDCLFLP